MVHVHLDPVGGIAGDMFVAAMLHAFPQHREGLLQALAAAGLPPGTTCRVLDHRDHALAGLRFEVALRGAGNGHAHGHHDGHAHFSSIRDGLRASTLAAPVRERAIAILGLLAEVEGRIHGVPAEQVSFHEVGAWDSIADMVGAAYLIEAVGAESYSVAPLPIGSGRVKTAHGMLPVPAPAAAMLLQGFRTFDDGLPGERVTPTGAAVLRHLRCAAGTGVRPRILSGTGIGFGTKVFPGISNMLRVLVFEPDAAATADEVAILEFEVDDQTGEDLAIGLERLRALPDVLDVLQMPAFGKKGRMTTHVRLLVRPDGADAAAAACFRETTTIGLRSHRVRRWVLPREVVEVALPGGTVGVKVAARPDGGRTAKAESDALQAEDGSAARERMRRQAEQQALQPRKPDYR